MKKIIFIDDSPLDHFILKRILKRYKLAYEVNCTENGEEAIKFLEKHKNESDSLPDVILLDLYMPNFDGWECLEKIQQVCLTLAKPIKIYILSSFINPEDIQRAKQYDCVKSFIFKPITKVVLERLINEETRNIL
ncbi:response regulator [Mucilaginibacter sp. McL0603]|uniref:response regulator n=1 Tax=Mucilaginibacter sp. McL0603 TaxID=3415670 RepID=UPI003CED3D09